MEVNEFDATNGGLGEVPVVFEIGRIIWKTVLLYFFLLFFFSWIEGVSQVIGGCWTPDVIRGAWEFRTVIRLEMKRATFSSRKGRENNESQGRVPKLG